MIENNCRIVLNSLVSSIFQISDNLLLVFLWFDQSTSIKMCYFSSSDGRNASSQLAPRHYQAKTFLKVFSQRHVMALLSKEWPVMFHESDLASS